VNEFIRDVLADMISFVISMIKIASVRMLCDQSGVADVQEVLSLDGGWPQMSKINVNTNARDLGKELGRPDWLTAIGVAESNDGYEGIIIYAKRKPKKRESVLFENGYKGSLVIVKVIGKLTPLGK